MSMNQNDLLMEFNENIKFDHNLKKKNWFNIGGNTKIYYKAVNLKELIRFLKVLPLVLILVGCAFSFFSFNFIISSFIKFEFFLKPLNDALKKIKSLGNPLSLYLKLISYAGIVMTLPDLLIACTEIKISLNSLSKPPAFIFIPPPTVPGMQDKNSNPPKLLSIANSESALSVTALPAIIISSDKREILLKLFDNLITTPS